MSRVTGPSTVRYARIGEASLAYQTWGAGPATIVAIPPLAQNIELTWERPEYRTMLNGLGSFARVLHFDKRGTGASDRTAHMPTMDERVEDLRAVMDHAGIARAHLLGVSEGGPMALALAATYPDLVEGVVLMSSGARIYGDATPDELDAARRWAAVFADRWGTEDTLTLVRFAPSLAADPGYRAWEPRYERQSASPAAIRELLEMIEAIDVRSLLPSIAAPILALHRRGDQVVSVERSREVVAGAPDARLIELDGDDHMAQAGDVHAWLDHVEAFITGTVTARATPTVSHHGRPVIATMGGFAVQVGGQEVPLAAWGSRRARQLCKRLAVDAGRPVPREQLVEMLWPGESDADRMSARLSVLLSNIRRVLGGGLVADRAAVALDVSVVRLDLRTFFDALAGGDDASAVRTYAGPLLPEDAYEDWATEAREVAVRAVIGAHRRLATAAASVADVDEVVNHTSTIIELDPFDEWAHEQLVRTLARAGRHGDAARADDRYRQLMAELGVRPQDLIDLRTTFES
jgi:pimeloyl-ACP methyl ester carboxylesterase/DNA-binding SARP family transcriptional activator